MKKFITILFILIGTVSMVTFLYSCQTDEKQAEIFLYKFTTDSAFAIDHQSKNLEIRRIDNIETDNVGKQVYLSQDSVQYLKNFPFKYMKSLKFGEAVLKLDKALTYQIYTFGSELRLAYCFLFDEKKGEWELVTIQYYNRNYIEPEQGSHINVNSATELVSRFMNDEEFRENHVAEFVPGRNYEVDNSTFEPASYDTKWDREEVLNILNYFFNELNRDEMIDQLWMEKPGVINYLYYHKQEGWGLTMIFEWNGNKWLLKKMSASNRRFPSKNGTMSDLMMLENFED